MNIIVNPVKELWEGLTLRVQRSDADIEARVCEIVEQVRRDKDLALRKLTREIEGVEIERFEVTPEEFATAEAQVTEAVKRAIAQAMENIGSFHRAQRYSGIEVETAPGVTCWQKSVPIQRVGLYVPGGTAPLFSTVLMLALPARIAGCPEVILCTPADKQGKISAEVLYAAAKCEVDKVYKVGGAQAIAAMAYGTESIARVHKIFGPGNRYVTKAKQRVSSDRVAIDMQAGPSEVLVIADERADPAFVASDLLSQAEHGADSQVMLLCCSEELAKEVEREVEKQLVLLPRCELAAQALKESRTVVFDHEEEIVDFTNLYAPEHLIVATENPWEIARRITAAGSIFLGRYSPESAGDYASGTNHTLPTSGTARAFSGVNIDSFIRKITYQQITRQGLYGLSETLTTMAETEGLQAHANAVRIRLK